ncbi:MAG: hypothetical protein HYR51_07230 [Candidatus Rokubacteria bacterium]|nr:hypothetical protein [Candidatus Rokubacteria bacterium]
MKIAMIALVFAGLTMAAPAAAHVVEVTTAVAVADVKDATELRAKLDEIVARALSETIKFEPSVVGVTGVRVVGDQLLIGLLFADKDGEAILEAMQGGAPDGDGPGSASPRLDPDEDSDGKLKI